MAVKREKTVWTVFTGKRGLRLIWKIKQIELS